jgi:hypothetical protein
MNLSKEAQLNLETIAMGLYRETVNDRGLEAHNQMVLSMILRVFMF